ncbi:hypothetical protein ACRS3X_17210 [Ectopseudomonas hydrolytica]|uniref:hypothetical protein n=1 Tax=Ectopseudomonas hydrolytica TaxID=2493633 RepID=UPI003EE2400F
MSTHNEHELKAYRHRLLGLLTRARNAPDLPSMDADFYIVLGWISAAHCLGAISIDASDSLHELVLNASQHRAAEFAQQAEARRLTFAQERAA